MLIASNIGLRYGKRVLFENEAGFVYGHKVSKDANYDEAENHNIVITTNKVNAGLEVGIESATIVGVENEEQADVVSGNDITLRDVTFKNITSTNKQVMTFDNAVATISDVKLKNVKADYFIKAENSKVILTDNKFNNGVFEKAVMMLGNGTKTTLKGANEFKANTLGSGDESVSEAVFNVSLDNNSSFTLSKDSTLAIKENAINKTDIDQAMIKFTSSAKSMPVTINGDLIIEDNKYINNYESEHIISGYMANGTAEIGAGKVVINNNKVYDDEGVTISEKDSVHILYADIDDKTTPIFKQVSGTKFNSESRIKGILFNEENGFGQIINNWTNDTAVAVNNYNNIFVADTLSNKDAKVKYKNNNFPKINKICP